MNTLTLQTIRVAVADQLRANLDRQVTVRPYSHAGSSYPRITIRPDDPYVSYFQTMGPDGIADVALIIRVAVWTGDQDSTENVMDDFLSVGLNNESSIIDALMADQTLGGLVQTLLPLTAGETKWGEQDGCYCDIPIIVTVKKQGANA